MMPGGVKDLQSFMLVFSPTKYIISIKIVLEYVFAAYRLMGFDCILSIVNKTTDTCVILPDNTRTEEPKQGIKYQQYSENKRKYCFLQQVVDFRSTFRDCRKSFKCSRLKYSV